MPLYFVSAADGTNVVRLFRDAIRLANAYRSGDTADFIDQILRELEVSDQRNRSDVFFPSAFLCKIIDGQFLNSLDVLPPLRSLRVANFDCYGVHAPAAMGHWDY